MPTWGEIQREIISIPPGPPTGPSPYDIVRRKYLKQLAEHTGRSTIIYMTAGFSPPPGARPQDLQISLDPDQAAFMEVVHGLPKDVPIDLVLHSPGGTAEAAETIISYLRGRFPGLRVIVPLAAMSAATMMAMGADSIVMGAHSQLGPIDPQLTIQTPDGPRSAPAAAIKAQFAEAQKDLASHPANIAAWMPILRSMAPALLQICDDAEALSKAIVTNWLEQYMFSGDADPKKNATGVAERLSDYSSNLSHARRFGKDDLRAMGLTIEDLETEQVLQDLVLSVFHAASVTIDATSTVKLVENHLGRAYIRRVGPPVLAQQQPGNRQERRAKKGR